MSLGGMKSFKREHVKVALHRNIALVLAREKLSQEW